MKYIIIFFTLVMPISTYAQLASYKVKIDGIRNGAKFYYQLPNQEQLQEVNVSQGKGEFNGEIVNPGIICMMITQDVPTKPTPLDSYYIYVTGGEMQVSFKGPHMSVAGNEFAVAYNDELLNPVLDYQKKIYDLAIIHHREPDPNNEMLIKEATIACFNVPKTYIKKHVRSPLSIQALEMMGDGMAENPVHVTELEELFASLDSKIRNSDNGKAYSAKLSLWKERELKLKSNK